MSCATVQTRSFTAGGRWSFSGLKTLLETGERLTTPGSLMYADATAAS